MKRHPFPVKHNSPRQRRNRTKANRRKEKLFAALNALQAPPGYEVGWAPFDFGTSIGVVLTRPDGVRVAIRWARRDRLWRHLDHLPEMMLGVLLAREAP